jgi:hypothetical protein
MVNLVGRGRRSLLPALLATMLAAICGCAAAGPTEPTEPASAVFRVDVVACDGNHLQRATAVAVAGDLAATVAHTFSSARSFELIDHAGQARAATIVLLDPGRDVALLRLDDATAPSLLLGRGEDGGSVELIAAAADGTFTTKPAVILRHVDATLDGEGDRAALELEAEIEPGDSGAPLIDGEGRVVGIVFAAARSSEPRGWGIAASEVEDALARRSGEDVALSCEPA